MSENGEFKYDPDKNYDEETMAQQKEIEREMSEQPLIDDKLTLDIISKEYAKEDIIYQDKLKLLSSKFCFIRRARGDGNCFYRAFAFSYLEYLVQHRERIDKFYDIVKQSKDELFKQGFPMTTVDDFYENFMSVLDEVKGGCHVGRVLQIFNDQFMSDYIVVYLRLIVSGKLQKDKEFYMNFLEGDTSVDEFCHTEVEPMGRECDHIHVIAMTTALDVSVQIAYMDRGETSDITSHVFPSSESTPEINLLYRPGHYDILYTQ